MVTVVGVLAATWGVIMAVAPALQIRRMLVRRSSEDISLGYFAILLPGFGLWIGYGIASGDWALVIPNVVALTVGVITVVVALYLRRAGLDVTVTSVAAPTAVPEQFTAPAQPMGSRPPSASSGSSLS